MITKILVGVDGSEFSQKALDCALDIAEKFSASIHILNVFQLPIELVGAPNVIQPAVSGYAQDQTAYPQNMVGFAKDLRVLHEKILSKATERAIGLKPNVKVTSELKDGEPPSMIVEVASEGGFDLIVVGHKGESRFNELFLGSTSERVAHQAGCTVLIAK